MHELSEDKGLTCAHGDFAYNRSRSMGSARRLWGRVSFRGCWVDVDAVASFSVHGGLESGVQFANIDVCSVVTM